MDVDMRSEFPDESSKLVEAFHGLGRDAVDQENRARRRPRGKWIADVELFGDRPSCATRTDSPLVPTMASVDKAFGLTPAYDIGSTDSSIPISMGLEAIAIGRGPSGQATRSTSVIDAESRPRGPCPERPRYRMVGEFSHRRHLPRVLRSG